ncbi:hypothetical protein HGRIS_002999 [Hohenbuehelia grisea]|uniref:Glutaredoxin domain-containing protein n=1 Tax=Hohenbuehelia grisea TaxID=104357 RepID=A0ABR3JNE2_9AGAR
MSLPHVSSKVSSDLPTSTSEKPSPSTPENARSRRLRSVVWLATGAIVSVFLLSGFMLCTQNPAIVPSPTRYGLRDRLSRFSSRLRTGSPHRAIPVARTQALRPYRFQPHQELAALTSFITASPMNVLPLSIQPSHPIDPQLVLGFDLARASNAGEELQVLATDLWIRFPVVLYSKHFCHHSRLLKRFLLSLNLKPSPTFIDVDTRDDFPVLHRVIQRVTHTVGVPVLLIGGNVLQIPNEPQADDRMALLHYLESLKASGKLGILFSDAGAIVDGMRRKKMRINHKHSDAKKALSWEEQIDRGMMDV